MHTNRNGCAPANDRRAGLTLIEVMVALVVIGLATGGMYALASTATRVSARARNHYLAVNMAKARIESAKARDFAQLDRFLESNSTVNASGALCNAGGEFRRNTYVSNVETGMVELIVVVDIRDPATGQFLGENETISVRLTDFQDKPR